MWKLNFRIPWILLFQLRCSNDLFLSFRIIPGDPTIRPRKGCLSNAGIYIVINFVDAISHFYKVITTISQNVRLFHSCMFQFWSNPFHEDHANFPGYHWVFLQLGCSSYVMRGIQYTVMQGNNHYLFEGQARIVEKTFPAKLTVLYMWCGLFE